LDRLFPVGVENGDLDYFEKWGSVNPKTFLMLLDSDA
jgi:hypothetical protein